MSCKNVAFFDKNVVFVPSFDMKNSNLPVKACSFLGKTGVFVIGTFLQVIISSIMHFDKF